MPRCPAPMLEPPPLRTRLVCRVEAQLGEVQEIGTLAHGRRRVVPIAGGRLHGPLLNGEILAGGADWQLLAADGTAQIEARYTVAGWRMAASCSSTRAAFAADRRRSWRACWPARSSIRPSTTSARSSRSKAARRPTSGSTRRLFIAVAVRLPDGVVYDLHELL